MVLSRSLPARVPRMVSSLAGGCGIEAARLCTNTNSTNGFALNVGLPIPVACTLIDWEIGGPGWSFGPSTTAFRRMSSPPQLAGSLIARRSSNGETSSPAPLRDSQASLARTSQRSSAFRPPFGSDSLLRALCLTGREATCLNRTRRTSTSARSIGIATQSFWLPQPAHSKPFQRVLRRPYWIGRTCSHSERRYLTSESRRQSWRSLSQNMRTSS